MAFVIWCEPWFWVVCVRAPASFTACVPLTAQVWKRNIRGLQAIWHSAHRTMQILYLILLCRHSQLLGWAGFETKRFSTQEAGSIEGVRFRIYSTQLVCSVFIAADASDGSPRKIRGELTGYLFSLSKTKKSGSKYPRRHFAWVWKQQHWWCGWSAAFQMMCLCIWNP